MDLSIWVRRIVGDSSENVIRLGVDSWDLRELFKIFEKWLITCGASLEAGEGWIVDIGFSPRPGASGGGPIISPDIMSLCVEKRISIYLSEYGDSDGEA